VEQDEVRIRRVAGLGVRDVDPAPPKDAVVAVERGLQLAVVSESGVDRGESADAEEGAPRRSW